jgi:hypothetical protein
MIIETDDGKFLDVAQFVSPYGSPARRGSLELIGHDGQKLGELIGRLGDFEHITSTIPERPESGQRGEYVA